jgi:lipoate-protein ligase A
MKSDLATIRYSGSVTSPFPTGEDVLDAAAEGLAYRVWIPPSPILVLGNSQVPDVELNVENVAADGIPVYQRKGGGGAVLLTPGCVCLAVRFPKRIDWGIHDYFAAGNKLLSDAVGVVAGLRAVPRGISDLAVSTPEGERKISGSSLYMPRGGALYLASLLVSADIGMWDRSLKHPSREPDYRAGRGHGAFVANVSELAKAQGRADVSAEAVRDELLNLLVHHNITASQQ